MWFWIVAALATYVTLGLLLLPLLRRAAAPPGEPAEIALYRAQLSAIEEELSTGRIAGEEAEATAIEIKRRMIAASRARARAQASGEESDASSSGGVGRRKLALLAIGAGVPLIALAIYLSGGQPGLPGSPYAGRAAERAAAGLPSPKEEALIKQLAEQMALHPQDPAGWALLGGAYLRSRRYDDAVGAFENAKARKPDDPQILALLGQALVLQGDGEITEEARESFEAALKLDPDNDQARYFMGLAKAQAGDPAGAIAIWTVLLSSAPAEAPWRKSVETALAEAKQELASSATQNPSGAAGQRAMIDAMVARLAAQLERQPGDLAGWLRLAHSYVVLDQPDKARAALDKAQQHFARDAQAIAQIAAARREIPAKPGAGNP